MCCLEGMGDEGFLVLCGRCTGIRTVWFRRSRLRHERTLSSDEELARGYGLTPKGARKALSELKDLSSRAWVKAEME